MHDQQRFFWLFGAGCQPIDRCRASWTASRGSCTLSSRSVLFGPRSRANSDLVQSMARHRLVLARPRIGRLPLDCRYSGTTKMMPDPFLVDSAASNQSMKPTAPWRNKFSVFAATPWISSRCPAYAPASASILFPVSRCAAERRDSLVRLRSH
jgi:hypothetical protein